MIAYCKMDNWKHKRIWSDNHPINSGLELRSGKRLPTLEEDRFRTNIRRYPKYDFDYDSEDDYEDVEFSYGELFGPAIYERMRVKYAGDDYGDGSDDEEYGSEDHRAFMEEMRDVERSFDLAEIRNKIRGYVLDSRAYGHIDDGRLCSIVECFNKEVGTIEKGLSVEEYEKVCGSKFEEVLSALCEKGVISLYQNYDVLKRYLGYRGDNNNTLRRNKKEYFRDDCESGETIEETTEEKVETVRYESDSETETTETKVVTKTETNIYR